MRNNDIIRKIEALLELAKSEVNLNEAIAAAEKAQQLMSKYKIDLSELEDKDEDPIIETDIQIPRIWWSKQLAAVIAQSYRCKCYVSRCRYEVRIIFVGHESDVYVATSMYEFFKNFADVAYAKYFYICKSKGMRVNKQSYMYGFIDAIRSHLESNCTELQLVVPDDVEGYYDKINLGKSANYRVNLNSRDSYERGKSDGLSASSSRHVADSYETKMLGVK